VWTVDAVVWVETKMLRFFVFVVLAWIALGIIAAIVKGLFWLFIAGLVIGLAVMAVRANNRNRIGRNPW
jgi:predicted membrane channel-forming protein YqfA (hemolysin III family)